MNAPKNAIEFDNCSIIFGKRPKAALAHADAGRDRAEIQALTGNVLGVPVVRALNSVNTALGFESGIIIVVVAIMLDRMLRVRGRND